MIVIAIFSIISGITALSIGLVALTSLLNENLALYLDISAGDTVVLTAISLQSAIFACIMGFIALGNGCSFWGRILGAISFITTMLADLFLNIFSDISTFFDFVLIFIVFVGAIIDVVCFVYELKHPPTNTDDTEPEWWRL